MEIPGPEDEHIALVYIVVFSPGEAGAPPARHVGQLVTFLRMQAVFKILIADQIPHLVQQNRAEMQGGPFVNVIKMKLHILQIRHFFTLHGA